MLPTTKNCLSADQILRNAECLLGRVEEVRRVLGRQCFSEHAIDRAVTAVYSAAMPYITGRRICLIENRRAWVFRVALRAAKRAAMHEMRCHAFDPAILATIAKDPGELEELFDIRDVLSQLTEQQSEAVQLCILNGTSLRDAARSMGIAVGTLCRHLCAGRKRLKAILDQKVPQEMNSR
jgi:DNA-directed RNA polymerase specialized sigma24 family protein